MPVQPTARLSRNDLADLNAFRVVERLRSFTKAALELGVTTSALSHAIRNLETRLGVRLLNRTSRTVSPTDAGASLARRLNIGFQEIGEALEEISQIRGRPAGRLRLNVLSDGARLLIARHLPTFLYRYPEVEMEISVDDRMVDIVAEGFDAGIRFGGTVPEDLVAVKLGNALKWVAVASPTYLHHRPMPTTPDDLRAHACIQMRTGQGIIYKWEFERAGERRVIEVAGQVCVSETALAIELALAGAGIAYCLEARVAHHLRNGQLRVLLPDWSPTEPAMYLYYPGHRRIPQGLRELIDLLKEEMTKEPLNEI